MKLKLQHISLTFLLAFLAPAVFFTAHAQDAPSLVTDSYDTHSDGDRTIYLPGGEAEPSGGGTSSKALPVPVKDSASAAPQTIQRVVRTPSETLKPSQVKKQNKEEDESILSFNFLYYIIQKYKLQDIVD